MIEKILMYSMIGASLIYVWLFLLSVGREQREKDEFIDRNCK